MRITKGVFLSDIHLPFNIDLTGVFKFLKDLRPDIVILGGDIIDADKTYGVDSWTMEKVEKEGFEYYERDVKLFKDFIAQVKKATTAKLVVLEGNHEERYQRMFRRYPQALKDKFDFHRDACPDATWIPYGDYESFYRIGDMLFTHGTLYPTIHAKKMAEAYLPNKVVYGHIHDMQSFTTHNGDPKKPGRYALTSGCLCSRSPDYKKGQPNKWINGFTTFVSVDGVTTASSILIESWGFAVGGKIYK